MYFIDLPSIFRDKSVQSSIPNYFKNCEVPIICYRYIIIEFCNRWCKPEHVECDAIKDWKLDIFKIIDRRISFYSQNTNMLPRKPKISYRYLKSGIGEFHRNYVLVPADNSR